MSRAKVSTGAPTTDEVEALHGAVTRDFAATLNLYRSGKVLDKFGNPKPIPASLLASAARFLKDQGADRPKQSKPPVDTLKYELPKLPLVQYGDEPGLPLGARVTEPKVNP